jgi:hypothetical protein
LWLITGCIIVEFIAAGAASAFTDWTRALFQFKITSEFINFLFVPVGFGRIPCTGGSASGQALLVDRTMQKNGDTYPRLTELICI